MLNAREGVGDLYALIQALQAEHASHGVPLGWLVWPTSHPDVTGAALQRHGFVHATDLVGMAIDFRELMEWMEPGRTSFELPAADATGFCQGLLSLGFGGDSPVHHYIARLDG